MSQTYQSNFGFLAFSVRHSLVFSVQANPGVYAVLLGSGISRSTDSHWLGNYFGFGQKAVGGIQQRPLIEL
jgi:hypothetical protein